VIELTGYTCDQCGASVDVRDRGRTRIFTCGHDGAVINAHLRGTVFRADGSVPEADLPAAHRAAFIHAHAGAVFTDQAGVRRYPYALWCEYIADYHKRAPGGAHISRLRSVLQILASKVRLRRPNVYCCSACGKACAVSVFGKISRTCGHDSDPIAARVSASLSGPGNNAVVPIRPNPINMMPG
jgi:hypothetical protein